MLKELKKAFTLAEVLIVIGIIGVVAALTLPNLNHATGDKETVTRLQKAYSILSEANDRAVAIYGPISTWKSNEQCADNFSVCWMRRIGEFLKISKSCDETSEADDAGTYISCDTLFSGDGMQRSDIMYELSDNITFSSSSDCSTCDCGWTYIQDLCITDLFLDIDGPNKGKNKGGYDIFMFGVSNSLGVTPRVEAETQSEIAQDVYDCTANAADNNYYAMPYECTWWVLEYGNLDYLKADQDGKCNDSNIILDGTTNTSCH